MIDGDKGVGLEKKINLFNCGFPETKPLQAEVDAIS